MPILREETCVFPEDLLDGESQNASWWAMYTKARQEKSFARNLLQRRISFYLPLIGQDRMIRGRRVTAHIPLFTGYVFVCGDEEDRVQALKTNRVSQVIPVADPAQLMADLRQIKRLIDAKASLSVESRLEPGQRVRVRNGPFAGAEGTVVRRHGKRRLLVAVNFLEQGVSMELEDAQFEPI